ncbi:MAG TPA: hypothetical protein VLX58_02925 [Bryobacteraceae bacterium]|nr:hypothetical protein [Bryobacteraceae bacterium]
MNSGPSGITEAIVALLVPPACREEVLGDLHERFKSPLQYAADALLTVPLVIVSRMRRTADPQILLIQAFALYMSFLGAAWLRDGAVLGEQWRLLRPAIPAAMAMLGLILDDTYANPGRRSSLNLARGPLLGLALALASQGLLWISNPALALPRWITFYGCAMSLLLSSAIRMLFPPVTGRLQGANAPAHWLKQAGVSPANPLAGVRVLKGAFIIVTVAIVGTWMIARATPSKAPMVPVLLVLLVAYQVWKRG